MATLPSPEKDAPGVWLVYEWDHGPYAIALFSTCEEAARNAARQGYGKVGRWPFGMELREAVKAWEARPLPPGSDGGVS